MDGYLLGDFYSGKAESITPASQFSGHGYLLVPHNLGFPPSIIFVLRKEASILSPGGGKAI